MKLEYDEYLKVKGAQSMGAKTVEDIKNLTNVDVDSPKKVQLIEEILTKNSVSYNTFR